MKLLKEIKAAKEELEKTRKTVETCLIALDKEVAIANNLLAKIESAEKRGGVLLLNDIDTGLIEKLQSLTPDDNVVIVFTSDGGRIEIKHKDTNYVNKPGMVR